MSTIETKPPTFIERHPLAATVPPLHGDTVGGDDAPTADWHETPREIMAQSAAFIGAGVTGYGCVTLWAWLNLHPAVATFWPIAGTVALGVASVTLLRVWGCMASADERRAHGGEASE